MPNKNNVTDVFGKDLSILCCYNNKINDIDNIDPNAQDWENGYSPLHLTLSNGFLHKSFAIFKKWRNENEFLPFELRNNNHLLNKLDRENLNPLELYNLTLSLSTNNKLPSHISNDNVSFKKIDYNSENNHETIQNESSLQKIQSMLLRSPTNNTTETLSKQNGSHLLTLGSNTNFQLGTGNKDDRQKFFQLHINQLNNIILPMNDNCIKNIKLSKYHSILYTTNNEIFVCGNSTRGRLGNGITDKPTFSFKRLNFNNSNNNSSTDTKINIKILQIEISDHHNLLLTNDSTVYSWGWNAYGQLGYSTSKTTNFNESQCSPTLRKINFLDGKRIKFINCSKIHSCAISTDGLVYFWGLNVGQMGNKDNSHLQPDIEYNNVQGHIMEKPIILNLQNLDIEQVVCTEFTTFIRSKGNILTVLNNYQLKTFKIPLARTRNYKELDPFKHFNVREISNDVVDMKCSNKFGNNICFRYKCGRIGVINWKNENNKLWSNVKNNILPVSLIWSPNYNFRRCLDFDVGFMGNLIICTIGGEVFKIKNIKNVSVEKLYSGKLIFGRPLRIACDSTFASFTVIKDETNHIPILSPRDNLINEFALYSPLTSNNHIAVGNKPFDRTNFLNSLHLNDDMAKNLAQYDISLESDTPSQDLNSANFDVTFIDGTTNEVICYCHKLLLSLRCTKLVNCLLDNKIFTLNDNITNLELISDTNDSKWRIKINTEKDSTSFTRTIKEIVHFLYTDRTPDSQQSNTILVNIVEDALHFQKLPHYMNSLLNICLEYDSSSKENLHALDTPDTKILLSDGIVYGHSMVLSARSTFFKLSGKNEWSIRDNHNMLIVDLKHHSSKVFKCIMAHIYCFTFEESLLDSLDGLNYFESLQFLINLLQLTDELLYWNFKNYLEGMISKYINGETVIPIIVNASHCNANLLRTNCAWYIISHIGILFTKDNIPLINEYFDVKLWQELEHQLQLLKTQGNESLDNADSVKPWYRQQNINWLALFKKDIKSFNELFMSSDKKFDPVIEIKFSNNNNEPKVKSTGNRRKSSVTPDKIAPVPSIVKIPPPSRRTSSRESFSQNKAPLLDSAWKSSITDSSAIDDSDVFVEVTRKTRRKNSEISKPTLPKSIIPETQAEILIHTQSKTSSELPSLLGDSKKPLESSLTELNHNTKSIGTFKKNSQKQRRKNLFEVEKVEPEIEKKTVWGGKVKNTNTGDLNPTNKKVTAEKINSHSSKALPSLLDTHSVDIKQSKKKKKNSHKDKSTVKYTEFVSTGNPGGIRPYMTSNKVEVNQIAATFGNTQQGIPPPVSSIEEKMAAMEFEKWFAKESSKVQKKIKKNGSNLNAVYSSAQQIPDFVIGNENNDNKSTKKKIRAKFPSKHKTQLTDTLL